MNTQVYLPVYLLVPVQMVEGHWNTFKGFLYLLMPIYFKVNVLFSCFRFGHSPCREIWTSALGSKDLCKKKRLKQELDSCF